MWTFGFIILTAMTIASGDILILPYGRFIEAEMYDEPALFGNGLPYEGLHGMVLYSDPPNGCGPMQQAPKNVSNLTGRWILLVARFNCSFEEKVRNAQTANYDAVIVHNIGSEALERMSANNSTGIHIPSVFVSQSDGLMMANIYANNSDYFIIINAETRINWNNLLIPFLIVVGMCFLVMVVFMVIKCVRDRRRQRRERLSSSALNKIPTHKFQKGDPYETCAICLDDYVDGEKLRVLPCAHAYHSKCIDPWLTKNRRVCPVCKRRVFAQDETRYSDSENDTDSDDTTPLLAGGAAPPISTRDSAFMRELISSLFADRHSINGEQEERAPVIPAPEASSSSSSSDSYSTTSEDALVVPAPASTSRDVNV
ncbi:E3 ubiquitin-protein ligase RNF13 isoform X2 [Atheta coriaria]|uniref:E3 ubiquitin-protein ligase RNF13 isoform X2 n=1 Tax=Dalotia coriaria TaxID=877792 RepID=UPI0031F45D3A